MKNQKFIPKFDDLDEEEKKMEKENEQGEWISVENLEEEKLKLQMAAWNTVMKDKGIATFPVAVPFDIYENLKKKAKEEKETISTLAVRAISQYVR